MLQVENSTPFKTAFALFPDQEGVDTVYPIIKGTFDISSELRPSNSQLPLVEADEYTGEPGESSLARASELAPMKPATDLLLTGHAYPPGGRPAQQVDVTLSVAGKARSVRVVGDRTWKNGFFGASPTDPISFEKMPLVYERAFGGTDVIAKSGTPAAHEQNPVGTGYLHPKGSKNPDGTPLPNLEDPQHPIQRPKNSPPTACFGPVCASWLPRRQYAGTYDEKWQKERAPFLPADFDPRFLNVAPDDQVFSPYLTGGEEISVINASPSGTLTFTLPRIEFEVMMVIEGTQTPVDVKLDTVCIEPDGSVLTMIWRGRHSIDKKMLKIEKAVFGIKSSDIKGQRDE